MASNTNLPATERVLGYFCNEAHPTEDLFHELRGMTSDERTGVLKSVRDGLRNLDPDQRKIADENMRLLQSRITANTQEAVNDPEQLILPEAVTQLRKELAELQISLNDPFADNKDDVPAAIETVEVKNVPYEEPAEVEATDNANKDDAPPFKDQQKAPPEVLQLQPSLEQMQSLQKETWFPRTPDPREWSNRQIATISALTLGLVGLYAWRKSRKAKEHPVTESNTQRKRSSLLYWVPGIGLGVAAFVYMHSKLMQIEGYANQYKKLIGEAEDIKQKAQDQIDVLKDGKGGPYGLTEQQYEDAEQAYRRKGDAGRPEIVSIFGLKPGESNEKLEKFMKEMEKNKAETINGIRYVPASVALRNYQGDVGAVLFECEQWIENHKFRVLAGTLLAARLGVLQKIINGGLSTADKVRELATTMIKFGMRHPIISIFLLGGSVYGASKISDKVRLPENLSELSKAVRFQSENAPPEPPISTPVASTTLAATQPRPAASTPVMLALPSIAINPSGEPIPQIDAACQHIREMDEKIPDVDQFQPWVSDRVAKFFAKLDTTVPGMLRLDEAEIISENTGDGIGALRDRLMQMMNGVERNTQKRNVEKLGEKIEAAMQLLDAFERAIVLLQTNDPIDPSDQSTALRLRDELGAALDPLGIQLLTQDGLVRWQLAGMSKAFDLCVDPAITDRSKIKALSERMRQGEDIDKYLWDDALAYLREQLGKRADGWPAEIVEHLSGSKMIGMISGSFMYIVENPAQASWEYVKIPVDAVYNAVGAVVSGDPRYGQELGITLERGAITCTFFSLNAAWIAAIKRLYMGGGTFYRGNLAWRATKSIFMNCTPIVSQINLYKNLKRTSQEYKWFRTFGDKNFAKEANTVLAQAHLKPEWIKTVETSMDPSELRAVGNSMNIEKLERHGTNIEGMRAEIKTEMLKRMRNTDPKAFKDIRTAVKGPNIYGGAPEIMRRIKIGFSSVDELRASGMTIEEMLEQGITLKRLVKEGVLVEDLLRANVSSADLLKAGISQTKIDETLRFLESVDNASRAGDAVGDAADAARVNPSTPDAPKPPDASPSAPKDPGTPEPPKGADKVDDATDASQAAKTADKLTDAKVIGQIDELIKDKNFAKLLKESGRNGDEVKAILAELQACDADTLAKIRMSPKAQRLLAGAFKVKGAEGAAQEAAHVLKLANRAKSIRIGFNAFGAGLDVLGFAMAFVDMANNRERIRNTNNLELQEIYRNAYYVQAGDAAASGVGLVYSGVCMYIAAKGGATLGTALSAGAGLMMLPIGAAVFAARQTHESLEKSAVYHTMNERDMTREYSPGKIVQHIAGSTSVESHTWTQDYFLDEKLMRAANLGARTEGYVAYFRQIAPAYVPPALEMDLPQPLPKGQKPEVLLQKENRERMAFFICKSLEYIRAHSNATFEVKDAHCMEKAALYAQKCYGEQYVRGKDTVLDPNLSVDLAQDAFLAESEDENDKRPYQVKRQSERVSYIASVAAEGRERFAEEGIPLFVEMLRHDLAFCERAILDANYSNVSTMSGDAYMQTLARGKIASELWASLNQLRTSSITAESIIKAFKHIREEILSGRDMAAVANAAYDSPSREQFLAYGSASNRLSVDGMLDHVRSYPFLAPKTISNDRNNPTRFSALELHSDGSKQYTLRPAESGPNQYHISGLNGWRFSRDQSAPLEKRWAIKSDVLTLSADPGDVVYLWKPPHSAIGMPDFTLIIAKQRQTPKKLAA